MTKIEKLKKKRSDIQQRYEQIRDTGYGNVGNFYNLKRELELITLELEKSDTGSNPN